MAQLVTTVTSTDVIVGPAIQLDTISQQMFSYACELQGEGAFPTYQRYGLVDLAFCGGTNGAYAFQADIATWYGYGVTRSYFYPWKFYDYVVARLWPDSSLIGKQIKLQVWKI